MIRRVLFDNDALLKLASYGLLSEVMALFPAGASPQVLHTAKYVLLPSSNRNKYCGSDDVSDSLEAFIAAASNLGHIEDPDLLDELNSMAGVDAGEALLLAQAALDDECVLITGDKRALAAISRLGPKRLDELFSNRIATLELVVSALALDDFATTQAQVRRKPDVDKALRIIFGASSPSSKRSVEEGFDSYIKEVRALIGVALIAPTYLRKTA